MPVALDRGNPQVSVNWGIAFAFHRRDVEGRDIIMQANVLGVVTLRNPGSEDRAAEITSLYLGNGSGMLMDVRHLMFRSLVSDERAGFAIPGTTQGVFAISWI